VGPLAQENSPDERAAPLNSILESAATLAYASAFRAKTWEIVAEYYDGAVRGADPIDTRPGFASMLKTVCRERSSPKPGYRAGDRILPWLQIISCLAPRVMAT
jgi:hypothetical protein